MNALESASVRPYLLRAIYEWCADSGLTPHIAVLVDDNVQVPREYVQDGQIVLNISATATSGLNMADDWVTFHARFGGVPREIMIPVDHVLAIFARESGEGLAFPPVADERPDPGAGQAPAGSHPSIQLVRDGSRGEGAPGGTDDDPGGEPPPESPRPSGRPTLKRVK